VSKRDKIVRTSIVSGLILLMVGDILVYKQRQLKKQRLKARSFF